MEQLNVVADFADWKECVGLGNADFDTMTSLLDALNGEEGRGNAFSIEVHQGKEYLRYNGRDELFELTSVERKQLEEALSYNDDMPRHAAEQFYKQMGREN